MRSSLAPQDRPAFAPLVALLLFALLPAGCAAPAAPLPTPLPAATPVPVWLGIEDGAEPLALVLDTLETPPPGGVLHLVSGSRQGLLDDLAAGKLDALFLHQLPPNADSAFWVNPVAVDGLALIVHPDNPVESLTLAEAQGIFSGQIRSWAEVGGPDRTIEPLIREEGASSRLLLRERVLGGQPPALSSALKAGDEALQAAVAENPAAIGAAMMAALTPAVRPLALDGLLPDRNTTGTQQYRLTTPLYFLAPAEPHGPLRALLAWLQSPEGQAALGARYGRIR